MTQGIRTWQSLSGATLSRRDLLSHSVSFASSLLALSALVSACDYSQEPVQLQFANNYVNQPNVKQRMDAALRNFTAAKVSYYQLEFDSALNRIIEQYGQGHYFDVMVLNGNWPYVLADRGILAPLDGKSLSQSNMQQLQNWHQKDAFPGTFELATYGDTLYAVPFGIGPYGLWYNKNLLRAAGLDPDKPPSTIEELESMMDTISKWGIQQKKDAKVYPICISTANAETTFTGLWPWIWTFGGNPMSTDGNGNVVDINWTDDGTIQAFTWLRNCAQNGWTPLDLSARDGRLLMTNNQIVFKLENPSMHSYIIDVRAQQGNADMRGDPYKDTNQLNQDFGVTVMPVTNRFSFAPGAAKRPFSVTVADIDSLAISARSPYKDQAWQLIYFLTHSSDVIQQLQSKDGTIPPYQSSNNYQDANNEQYYTDPISKTFINNIIPTMRRPPYGPLYTTAGEFIIDALSEIMKYPEINIGERLSQLNHELQILYYNNM